MTLVEFNLESRLDIPTKHYAKYIPNLSILCGKILFNPLFSHVTWAIDMRILSLCNHENKIHKFFINLNFSFRTSGCENHWQKQIGCKNAKNVEPWN